MQFFEFQDYVIFNPQNPHEFISNSKTQMIFYLWVSRDMGSCGFDARKELAGGAQGLGVCPQQGSHSADLSLPCSLPLPDPKAVWTENHTPSTPTLVRPSCSTDALHLSHSCFSMGLVPFSSFWKAAGVRRGCFVLSGRPWSLSAPGALLGSPQCGVWGGDTLALQSLVPKSLPWMFSLLSPG